MQEVPFALLEVAISFLDNSHTQENVECIHNTKILNCHHISAMHGTFKHGYVKQ